MHALKSQNFFPTVGANGPCTIHVNFGQSGFVFIEANVKKWGLAPMTGSLAPPPPYGSEQGSILLEAGRDGTRPSQLLYGSAHGHTRSRSGLVRAVQPTSPGPERSPTEISLAQLAHIPSREDVGEGSSRSAEMNPEHGLGITSLAAPLDFTAPPPDYTSPEGSFYEYEIQRSTENDVPEHSEEYDTDDDADEDDSFIYHQADTRDETPIPSYDAAVGDHRT